MSPVEPVVLACAANSAYSLPLAVMLRSVLTHLAPDHRLDVYLVNDGIAPDDRRRITSSLTERAHGLPVPGALVAPSLWAEPLGLVAPEAIVRGVPVVASATGGFSETVEHGVNGLLFPNGDEDALVDCLLSIARGDIFPRHELPAEVVARAAERHDLRHHVEQMRAILAGAARQPKRQT